MDFQKEALKDINFIIEKSGLTQGDISVRAGYQPQTLTQMISKKNISGRMMRMIRQEFKDVLNKATTLDQSINEPVKPPIDEPINEMKEPENRNYSDPAMLMLAESNRRLSEIIIKQTEVHYEEAKTNRILAEVNSNIISRIPSSQTSTKALREFSAQLSQVIEQMARRGVPAQWRTFEEGRAILDRLVVYDQEETQSKGSVVGTGRRHK